MGETTAAAVNRFMARLPGGQVADVSQQKEWEPNAPQPNPNLHANLQYPRMLRRWGAPDKDGQPTIERQVVRSEIEELEAVEVGWGRQLPPVGIPAPEPEAEESPRRGPGRPRKNAE